MIKTRRESGFTLVTAIFIIVILATLVGYMVSITGVQSATSLLALQGARAAAAARSGIEWGIYEAFNHPVATCGAAPATPATNSFTLNETGLRDFTVSVTCSYTNHTEQTVTLPVYRIVVLAQHGTYGSPDYVSRQMEVSVSDAPP